MFCRIYLCIKAGDSDLCTQQLAAVINAQIISERYIEKDGLSLEIRLNEDRDIQKAKEFPNGFVHFPYSIEIEAEHFSTHQTSVVDDLNKIFQLSMGY
ncbi:hypothetical protein D0C36_10370 [Mucilaginibacter conchicola]|uniref:Uncharacterized protein n=1 Tax=Mucilaginibacter conchicola TaxID=2303333 RepID=A0A372NRH1_9SPHI|nr:hypothetical protein [Mucilaginibacter conchicola]RFZ91845.1 hypothetical protein D0C36_10370 [Mucilaginibacter conchicola]